jgi:hypothetical protein
MEASGVKPGKLFDKKTQYIIVQKTEVHLVLQGLHK